MVVVEEVGVGEVVVEEGVEGVVFVIKFSVQNFAVISLIIELYLIY